MNEITEIHYSQQMVLATENGRWYGQAFLKLTDQGEVYVMSGDTWQLIKVDTRYISNGPYPETH